MRIAAVFILFALSLRAAVTAIHVVERSDVLDGRSMGAAGPYERIKAKVHFAIDPKHSSNWSIRDRNLAPLNAQGLVEFTADIYVLKPRDPAKGNGTLLAEVPNRGGKAMLRRFQYAPTSLDPRSPAELGDLFLLEQGFTLLWTGWQWDVPQKENLLRLDAPIVTRDFRTVQGLIRSEFLPASKTTRMPLSDRDHIAYPALDAPAKLTVRGQAYRGRKTIPQSAWRFTEDRTAIEMAAGFQPGLIYELVYKAENPRLAGAGLAAFRDAASFFKYGSGAETLLGDQRRFIKRAIAFGISQSGRFLRTFLYYGFNADEQSRKVFDGVWADVAGAGRGSFNHRFAQPSRDGYAYSNLLYPTDIFPFTDVPQLDPATGQADGLLMHEGDRTMPKIFYTNGSWEYWNRCAALVHTSIDGELDAPLQPQTRLYVYSGSQHGPTAVSRSTPSAQYPNNPNDFRPLQRALLIALHEWVKEDRTPPESVYPMVSEDQLVFRQKVKFPAVPKVTLPSRPRIAIRLDYGDDFRDRGIITNEPPKLGFAFPVLLPQVDQDGIDLGGVRMPEVAVPLGTFTGWNLRSAAVGAPLEMAPTLGSFFPFAKSKAERQAARDPRLSLEERYSSREDYLAKVEAAAQKLIRSRFLLERDKQRVLDHAAALWDSLTKPGAQ